eukprot:m.5711 g.5711  ORF g.5711 m.5711 type:complete len:351 (-) comp3369_c0_seq1:2124-3176(-)
MGSFLDKPVTEKETIEGAGNGLVWTCSSMQGWRIEMEDAHTCETNVNGLPGTSFFAVYDGHGGKTVSTLSAVQLLPIILNGEQLNTGDKSAECLEKALYQGLLDQDQHFLQTEPKLAAATDHSGSTCIASFITPSHIILANCGDSRALIARDDKVFFATKDHKPTDVTEYSRVQAAGGFIEVGRVCGNLAVSRSLGDFQYKDRPDLPAEEQKITCAADMTTLERHETDQFLLLCCDGIWDVMTNEEATVFVLDHLKAGVPPKDICERMMDHCLLKNSKDNMSVCLVLFAGAPKKIEGFPIPDYKLDPEEEERLKAESAEESALSRRLSTMLQSLQAQDALSRMGNPEEEQ